MGRYSQALDAGFRAISLALENASDPAITPLLTGNRIDFVEIPYTIIGSSGEILCLQ